MSTSFYELADNRRLGVKVLEITAIPGILEYGADEGRNCKQIQNEFAHLLTELSKLMGDSSCIELLWVTDRTLNQTFKSKIRIFCVIRKIGVNDETVEYLLSNVENNIMTTLSTLQYSLDDSEKVYSELDDLLEQVDDSCVYSVVKGEKCCGNMNSLYPYYYCDVVPNGNNANFNSLVALLSQSEDCCMCFQLFPTYFTDKERYLINEVAGELGRIVSGLFINGGMYKDSLAAEPLKMYNYYNEQNGTPVFSYNVLIFGSRATCAGVAAKLISHIQSGDEEIVSTSPACVDLSGEQIKLRRQFSYYVWNVNTRLMYYYRNRQLQEKLPIAANLSRLARIMTAKEAVAFFKLPLYEKNMTAFKNNKLAQVREQFSERVVNEKNIQIGKLIGSGFSDIMIGCPEKAFTKHALVVGTPGSGKTTFSVNILLQFAKRGIPFLAIEPTKSEYRAMIDALPDLRIFTPGNNAVAPYIINPFIPPRGIRIEQYIPSLASAFKAAFSMPSPLDMIFLKAIRECYIKYGWKDYSMLGDSDVQLFGLYEFIVVFKELMKNTNYSKEVKGNIESAGLLRLTNLIEQNSNIYDTINTVPIEDLLTAPTVLELNSIDNAEQKSLIMALLLINICVYTKHNQVGDGELKNVILIDEAHVLLGGGASSGSENNPDSKGTTVKALQDMIAEIRSYGTSIIIADQSPTKVSREVVANTDIKVSFRLVQSVEKEMIADSTNMDEEAKANISRLHPGEAYIYYSQLDAPQMVMTEDIREKEGIRLSVPDSEVAERAVYWKEHSELLKPYRECGMCEECSRTCSFNVRSNAEYIANSAFSIYRKEIDSADNLKKCIFYLPDLMKNYFTRCKDINIRQLQICTRIKLMRKIMLELPFSLSEKDVKRIIMDFPKE